MPDETPSMPDETADHPPNPVREEMLRKESVRWAKLEDDQLERTNWLNSPTIARHVNHLVADQDISWFDWVRARYLMQPSFPLGRGLCLGCNHGLFERQVVQAGICSGFDSFDISEETVHNAQVEADNAGLDIRYRVADVNTLELPRRAYSLVPVSMALHHFENLEHILSQIHDSLEPGGIFCFSEYVGPSRFQWTDAQLEVINALRDSMPRELLKGPDGKPTLPIYRPNLADFIAQEPFEAIRSADIMPVVREQFRVIDQRDYGGTVLHMLFHLILQNFNERNRYHLGLINTAIAMEQILIRQRVLDSDFTVVVAARRDDDTVGI